MDLDNEELIATKYSETKKAIEYFKHSLEFQTDAEIVKNIMIAIECMQFYINENEGNHIPRID